jgi:two-component system, response regulator YesN
MRKARVFIVEDEMLIRTGIKRCCDWEALGMDICGDADDGLIAWEQISSLSPDIILLDIRIPGIDGIELLRRIRATDSDCRVIIITNMQDFTCLHEAMALGITDYIVKLSITNATITKALEKAKGELMALYPEAGTPNKSHTYVDDFTPQWELALYTQPYDALNDDMQSVLIELCVKALTPYGAVKALGVTGHGILCLFSREPDRNDMFLHSIQHIIRYFKKLFSLNLCVLGYKVKPEEQHDEAYVRLLRRSQRGYWYRDEVLFLDGEYEARGASDVCSEQMQAQELKKHMAPHELEPFLAQAEALKKAATPEDWQNKMILMADHAIRHFLSYRRIDQLTRDILGARNAYTALDILLSIYHENQCRLVSSDQVRKEIREALAYIDSNYMQDISLLNIARHVMLNANYFSNMFVRETGMTFSSYLTRYRIERAKQLVQNEALTCDELAVLCGLGCASRFCRTFKQVTGLKLSEYKKTQSGEGVHQGIRRLSEMVTEVPLPDSLSICISKSSP